MRKLYLAVVSADYQIYAVATTKKEAREKALTAAMEWMNARWVADGLPPCYKSIDRVEEWVGCNIYPLSEYGVGQEG